MSMGRMPCSATAAWCAWFPRTCRMPPCTRGCSVLTRPSSISGKPVSSEMSFTGMLESRSSLAVPPVEKSSTFIVTKRLAKTTMPVLSVTLRIARLMMANLGPRLELSRRRIIAGELLLARVSRLDLGLRFQAHLAVLEFDRVFDRVAAVVFAYLLGLFLDEGLE